ncbi:MAG: D-alanyl-D-alanine dipeptidase [Phycisphaeraceae bacterium]|nr:D-alanyl-D-alanine dipeptidase [Phycisphaeraceae bacterium]
MGATQTTPLAVLRTAFSRSGYAQAESFLEQRIDVHRIRAVRASIPIHDDEESLACLPKTLVLSEPHAYVNAGAPYGNLSPWRMRVSVAERLAQAQAQLDVMRPGYCILVFDAFRPVAVQAHMIQNECDRLARETKLLAFDQLISIDQDEIQARVMQFWAAPSEDAATPPPHATGAAVDVTIVDPHGEWLPMGTDIDDLTDKAYPSYFADKGGPYHTNRMLLNEVMQQSGFHRNPIEWWHFSYGDQAWALIEALESPNKTVHAMYGAMPTD